MKHITTIETRDLALYTNMARLCKRAQDGIAVRDPKLIYLVYRKRFQASARNPSRQSRKRFSSCPAMARNVRKTAWKSQ